MFKRTVIIVIAAFVALSLLVVAFRTPFDRQKTAIKGKGNAKIAVIYVEGVIMGGRSQTMPFADYGGADSVIRQLHSARDDQDVKAVILRINSPGGTVPATQELGEEIKKLRLSGKPVVASMGDVAASGGYWIAALADKIYANPGTFTGSIGVYIPYANWEELYKKIGISKEKIKSGPHKDILSPERPMTVQERSIIQDMVDDMYNQFIAVVAEGRKMDPAKVRELADGRVYTGSQAKDLGLVDELGNLYDAIDGAAALAGIQGKPEIKEYGRTGPWSMLLGKASERPDDLKEILDRPAVQELPLAAPLAMPEKWW